MQSRIRIVFSFILLVLSAIILRLSYWQIVNASELERQASEQHFSQTVTSPSRGAILTSDNFPLVFNEPRYTVTAYTPNITEDPEKIAELILDNIAIEIEDPEIATDDAKREKEVERIKEETYLEIVNKLNNKTWSPLAKNISLEQKDELEAKEIAGLGFEEIFVRNYPEASMSAHTLGFVGKNDIGESTGYFGLEGYYDRELQGDTGLLKQEKDALGRPLLTGTVREVVGRDGRDLKLHMDRAIQLLAEKELKDGIERYGASSGEVVIMDPKTGGILAMASLPTYEPFKYWKYETSLYKNPVVANTYEPGSTFKVLVMAAALEEKAIDIDDKCDICHEPLKIGKYTIKTWDGKYVKDRTPEDIIVHSDNVGMVWTQIALGGDRLVDYIKDFGFGEQTGIDLQEEVAAPLRKKWGDIDHATSSFGQGIAVTSIQMVRAVSTIANGGKLLEPHVVSEVIGKDTTEIKPRVVKKVISPDTAKKVTDMMVASVEYGESKWTRIDGYDIAGKTGTAQIPVEGHYDEEKTIASFVGFAPAYDPEFVMLVKLREPTTSPWGSETAAPLWFNIAEKLFIHLDIPPSSGG